MSRSHDQQRSTSDEVVDLMVDQVLARLSQTLTEEQVQRLRRNIASTVAGTEKLRAMDLTNGDEPDFVFRPYTPEG
jgi:hypothetical protein